MKKKVALDHDFKITPKHNKEDFIWYVVPRMKSHVALHLGT